MIWLWHGFLFGLGFVASMFALSILSNVVPFINMRIISNHIKNNPVLRKDKHDGL